MRIEWAMFTFLLLMTTAKADGMTTREPVGSESCASCKDSFDASFLKCQTNHPNSPSFKLMICLAESLDFSCRNLDCICASIPMVCKDLDDLYTADTTENISWRNCTYDCIESIAASNNECGSNVTCVQASSDLSCDSCLQPLAQFDLFSELSSYPFCCKTKTVGGIAYTRVPRLNTDDGFSTCIDDCVYTRDGSPGSKFCFAKGNLDAVCTNPKQVTGNSAYSDIIIQNGLSVKLQGLVEYENCESDIFAVEGGNFSSNIQRGSCLVTNVHHFGFGFTCQTHFNTPTSDSLFSITDTNTGCKFDNDTASSNVNTRYDPVAVKNQYANGSTFSGVVGYSGWGCDKFSGLKFKQQTDIHRLSYLVTSIYAFQTSSSNSVNCKYSSPGGTGYSKFDINWYADVNGQSICKVISNHGCFLGNSLIQTPNGPKVLTDLRLGESVLTYREGHGSMFTKFLGWMDRHSSATSKLLQVTTADGSSTTLSASHVIFKMSVEGGLESVYAGSLVPGDKLAQMTETGLQEREIVAVEEKWELGYWAPLTNEGTILVDGFLASCYASYPHWISDLALAPLKMFPTLFLDDEASQHEDGVRGPVKILKELGALVGVRRSEPTKKMTDNLDLQQPWPLRSLCTCAGEVAPPHSIWDSQAPPVRESASSSSSSCFSGTAKRPQPESLPVQGGSPVYLGQPSAPSQRVSQFKEVHRSIWDSQAPPARESPSSRRFTGLSGTAKRPQPCSPRSSNSPTLLCAPRAPSPQVPEYEELQRSLWAADPPCQTSTCCLCDFLLYLYVISTAPPFTLCEIKH